MQKLVLDLSLHEKNLFLADIFLRLQFKNNKHENAISYIGVFCLDYYYDTIIYCAMAIIRVNNYSELRADRITARAKSNIYYTMLYCRVRIIYTPIYGPCAL